jgi:hypothetical protein
MSTQEHIAHVIYHLKVIGVEPDKMEIKLPAREFDRLRGALCEYVGFTVWEKVDPLKRHTELQYSGIKFVRGGE